MVYSCQFSFWMLNDMLAWENISFTAAFFSFLIPSSFPQFYNWKMVFSSSLCILRLEQLCRNPWPLLPIQQAVWQPLASRAQPLCQEEIWPQNQYLVHVSYRAYEIECSFLLSSLSLPYEITCEYSMRMYYTIVSGIYIQWFFRAWISTSVTSSHFSTNCQKVLYQNSFRCWGAKKTVLSPQNSCLVSWIIHIFPWLQILLGLYFSI